VWVDGFVPFQGAQTACTPAPLTNYLGYDSWSACLSWVQDWPIRWNFDDMTVNRQRLWGLNYGVAERGLGAISAVSHTYEYASDFDPLRNCVRPCRGDQTGPVLPGYPNGSPAFQVQIQTPWRLQLCQSWTSGTFSGSGCSWIDLTQLGAPSAEYFSQNVVPIPVLQYGGAPA
jgi:hypothetical protein